MQKQASPRLAGEPPYQSLPAAGANRGAITVPLKPWEQNDSVKSLRIRPRMVRE